MDFEYAAHCDLHYLLLIEENVYENVTKQT